MIQRQVAMKRNTFKTGLILSTLSILLFFACRHEPFKAIVNNTQNTSNVPYDSTSNVVDTSVCFQRDVLPIFVQSCAKAGCHDAATFAEDYNLSTYQRIIARGISKGRSSSSKVYTICINGEMPPYPTPKLDSTQLSYIRRWIDMGAPDDTNCIVTCDTAEYTYSGAIQPLLKKYCYGCHATAAASSGGGVVLDTYNGVKTQALNGKLLGDIQHSSGFNAMPLGGAKLTDCQITQVSKWINAGALNN